MGGADDGPAHGSPWAMQVVKAIIECSGEMQNDLCGKRLVGNFLEGFSTTDGCWLFDEIEGDVRSVVTHADNNVYLSVPAPSFTLCPGSVGQSLNTCLIENLFGGSDMNVFKTGDELRKHTNTFTSKVNIRRVTHSPPPNGSAKTFTRK